MNELDVLAGAAWIGLSETARKIGSTYISDLHFYTTQKISGRRSRTPEGYLLIEGVPLARTGMMIYGPDETPLKAGPDGLVYVERRPEEVFRPETMASANGKAIVNDHPANDVTPLNWGDLALGVLMNPRRGSGIEDDFFVGDVLVTHQRGIDLLEDGKIEVSMGYDAGYVQTAPGRGYQKDIVYNHVALVDKGRCGPRCSIGDRIYVQEKPMAKTNTLRSGPGTILGRAKDRLLGAVRAGRAIDEEMLEETLGDAEEERREPAFEIHNHHHAGGEDRMRSARDKEEEEEKRTEDRIRKMVADAMTPVLDAIDARLRKMAGDKEKEEEEDEGKDRGRRGKDKEKEDEEGTEDNEKILGHLEMEAPPGTNDRARLRRARDSSFMADSFQETAALAEVLCPGIRVPAFDSAALPKRSLDTICNLRRTALDHAYHADVAVRQTIDAVGGASYRTMDCGALRTVFLAAGQFKKMANNGAGGSSTRDAGGYRGGAVGGTKISIADINKRNREHYGKRA